MDPLLINVVARQADNTTGGGDATPLCATSAADTSYLGLRIASVFVIFVGSALGAILPIILARTSRLNVPRAFFFVAKYFGSGVILATAWMHLLSPASDNLRDECLTGILPDYDWAMGIGLMTVMVMFLIELVISNFDLGFDHAHDHGHENGTEQESHGSGRPRSVSRDAALDVLEGTKSSDLESGASDRTKRETELRLTGGPGGRIPTDVSYAPGGENHLGHRRDHTEGDSHTDYAGQMTAIFILEFGVIFHSIFVGLTLAITDGFIILFVVLVFHQTFEGLGLGSRLATASWPNDGRKWTPYILGMLYAVSTPIAIAIGLGVRQSLSLDGATAKIVNGVFDAVSGGILMYTGLVELLAHEFMFNPQMRKAGLRVQLYAYTCVAVGVALMAMLAKWA